MASTKLADPALHVEAKDFEGVSTLGNKILSFGLYTYPSIFSSIPVDITVFKPAVETLDNLTLSSKGNTANTKLRNLQSALVHDYLTTLCNYVKVVAHHDVGIITNSGFDSTLDPEVHVIPDPPVVSKIVEWKSPGKYKALIAKSRKKALVTPSGKNKKAGLKYRVETTLTTDVDNSWTVVLQNAASTKIIFGGLTAFKKNAVRIIASNSKGDSKPSAVFYLNPIN